MDNNDVANRSSGSRRELSETGGRLIYAKLTQKIDHFDGPYRCFSAFVTGLGPRPFECLLNRLDGQYAEQDRHTGLLRRSRNAIGDAACYKVVVRCRATNHSTEADHRLVASTRRHRVRHERNLERARTPRYIHCVRTATVARERIKGALK